MDREKLKEERRAKKELEKAEVGIIDVSHDKLSEISHTVYLYFAAYNPEKIDKIPKIMAKYRGREDELINDLFEKYGPIPGSQENNQATVNGTSNNENVNNNNIESSNDTYVVNNSNGKSGDNLITDSIFNNNVNVDQNASNEDIVKPNDDNLGQNSDAPKPNDDTVKQNDDITKPNDDNLDQNSDAPKLNDDTVKQNDDISKANDDSLQQQNNNANLADPQNSEPNSE